MHLPRPLPLGLALALTTAGCSDDSGQGSASASASASASTGDASTSAASGVSATVASDASATASSSASVSASASDGSTNDASTGEVSSDATTDSTTDATTDSTTDGTTGGETSTTGGGSDPLGVVAPSWLRLMDGLITLGPPRVTTLPDGDVVALVTGGLYAKEIIFAKGDDDEQVLETAILAPALAIFDRETGALSSARLLAEKGPNTQYGASVKVSSLDTASNGDLLVSGTWFGKATFFPGTGDSVLMDAPIKLNGDTLDRAEEPYYLRMKPSGAIDWLIRGRTPLPLQKTWFNYGHSIIALPGDDVLVAGDYEQGGFVFADGKPGEKVMSGSQSSYFARLGSDGSPTWTAKNSKRLRANAMRSLGDGAIYTLLPADAMILADSDAPTMTAAEPGKTTSTVGRLDPEGAITWTANVAWDESGYLGGYEVTASGGLIAFGYVNGEMMVRGADDLALSGGADSYSAWIAGFSADGEALWLRVLAPGTTFMGVSLTGDDGVWLGASVAAPFELEIGGELMSLPDLGFNDGEESYASLLVRIDDDGQVAQAQLLGGDLPITSLAWSDPDQSSFLVLGARYCSPTPASVIADDLKSLKLVPLNCDMEPLDDQPGYIAAIPRAL